MSLRIMSDLDMMSSSDEEIFVSSPLTKSTNTSINSTSSVNKQTINNDCAIKDVSVKITQLPMVEEFRENKKNTHRDNKIKKKKRVIRKWQKGIITKKKDRRAKAVASVENKAEEHRRDQLRIIEEHPTDVHQKLRQIAQSSLASLEIPISKEDTKVDRTYTSARILPYNFYQKDTSRDAETCFNSSSYLSESTEQLSHSYETSLSEETSSLKDAQLQRLQEVHYKVLELKIEKLFPKKLDEQIDKTNDGNESDSSMGLQPVLKKRRRRISSSESENRINNNNCSKSYLPCEETEQAESRTNMQITRKLRVTLMRIEDMINMSIVEQNREDALTISKSSVTEQQSSTEKARKLDTTNEMEEVESQETPERQNNEVISAENNGPSRTENISEDSKLSQLSDTRLQRSCLKQPDDLYIKKLKKKYKLFKKPRVLLIRLETLQVFVRNGNYSASEVERLMKKYIDFVIKSNCLFTSRAIRFKQLRNESTDVDFARTAEASVSSRSATNDSTEFAEKSPTKDDKITENNSVKKSSLVKFPCKNFMSMIPIDQYKLLQPPKDKSSVSPEKKRKNLNFPSSQELLKIWQNAFCDKSTGKTQKPAKQSVSSQSASEVPSVSQSPSKKSADTKCRDVSNPVASTSSSPAKSDTPAVSPKKIVSPNEQAAERNENVHELSPKCTTLSSNERVGETVSETDSPSLENKEILRSLLDSIKGNVVSSRPSLNLARKVTEKASPKSLEKLSPKSQEKSPSKSPGKSNDITSPVGEMTSSKISRVPWLSCETTQITFKCAKCNKTFEHFRAWQEHQNVCKKNTIVDSSSSNVPKQQTLGSSNPPMPQKRSGNTTSKPSSYKLTFEKCDKVCTVCSRNFDNNFEFYEHLKKHTDNPHKKVYSIFKTAFTSQKTDKQSEQASINMSKKPAIVTAKTVKIPGNKMGDRLLDDINRSNAERRVTSEVSQQDASMQTRNETSTISGTTEQNRQKQSSIFATRETEEENDEERSLSPVAICKCHRNVKVVHGENVPIEIVLQCTCCHVLFRLLECFEAHRESSALPSCANNSQNNRKARLFCNICQVMMNSLKDMYRHLVTHAKINRKGTVTFRCNICKVAFYGLGPLFNDHYGKHEKSSCFKSTRLDFPAATYVGSRLIRMPTADNDKEMSLYYEVADHMCPKCKTPFYTPLTLRIHIVTCRGNVGAVDNNSASSSDVKITSTKKKFILICGFCNRKFYNKAVFEHHSSEHKQKRELSSYYTFVSVTAVTKVFICKICTSVRQSLESFEEHWRTHGELREDYVCSICENHFDTFDLFEKHAIKHEKSVLCKVIYRDTNGRTSATSPHGREHDNPSSEDHREKSEKSASDKVSPITGSRESVKKRLFEDKEPEVITVPDITERVPSADTTQSPGTRKDSATNRAKDCPTIDKNAGSNFSSENNDNLEDSDEENLVIALSDDESTVSTATIGNTADNVPLVDRNDAGKRAANSVATAEQRKSTDMESVVSSAETSDGIANVTSGSSNFRKLDDVITQKEVATRLNASADVSGNKETCVGDTNVGGSKTGRDGCANDAVVHPVIIDVVPLNENPKEMPKNDVSAGPKELPKNDKSTENKTFLRVRSLAELTNTPLKSHVCYKCGQPFDCVRKLTEHITQHDAEQRKRASSLGNVQRQPTYIPILPKQAPNFAPQRPKAPPPYPANSNPIQQRPILSSTSRQYQVIGVRPLHLVAYSVVENKTVRPNMLQHRVPWTSQQKSTSAAVPQPLTVQQSTGPISEVSYPANNFVQQQTISVQQQQQQQSASTVAVRPFMQNFKQGSVSTPVLYQQHQLQQQPQLQQLYPHHHQQLLLQQQRLQQQQQQQHNNVVCNQYLRSQRKVSNPLAQSNTMPANTANNVNTSGNPNMAQQMTKTPEHLACLYCPGFKCVSITDFAAHLRSPKHEARSHYNDVPYMP